VPTQHSQFAGGGHDDVADRGHDDVADRGHMIDSESASSAPAGYRFPREVIAVSVRWYLRYGLSYRDVEELLAERGIEVDHVTVYRWVQTFTPEFIDAAGHARHGTGERWFVDETYVKVAGRWTYLCRAIDQHGQVIDVLCLATPRCPCCADVLHPRRHARPVAGRGPHRPGAALSTRHRRARAGRAAGHRAVQQQQRGG
jgi:hypothetical protein